MTRERYTSMEAVLGVDRRRFLTGLGTSIAVGGAVLGRPLSNSAEDAKKPQAEPPKEIETNLGDFMKAPRTKWSIPGPCPGTVVQVSDPACLVEDKVNAAVVRGMLDKGVRRLTGQDLKASFGLFFEKTDVVGLKVNPVGPPLINTRHELVDAVIDWLTTCGLPKSNIVIWDRFDTMLKDAGYTAERFPGVRIEAMQTMDEEGSSWRDAKGHHVSEANFDRDAFYYAKGIEGKGVAGYKDDEFYLNQHVFNGERSYFGTLVTKTLTKIVNLPVLKNTGHGISVATKNLGYGALCNVGRLHRPLFFRVCTEVLAAPWIRDKLVLNIVDGIRAQYDGGPGMNAQFVYPHRSLYVATDPFALDMVCQQQIVAKRKEMKVTVDEHPRYTDYLHQAEKLGLGVADPAKIKHVVVTT